MVLDHDASSRFEEPSGDSPGLAPMSPAHKGVCTLQNEAS